MRTEEVEQRKDLYDIGLALMFSRKLEIAFYVIVAVMGIALSVLSAFWVVHQIKCF